MNIVRVSLSELGKEKYGYIFGDSVPIQDDPTFTVACIDGLRGVGNLHVHWESLTEDEQQGVVGHLQRRCGADFDDIILDIEMSGYFSLPVQYLTEPPTIREQNNANTAENE